MGSCRFVHWKCSLVIWKGCLVDREGGLVLWRREAGLILGIITLLGLRSSWLRLILGIRVLQLLFGGGVLAWATRHVLD